MKPNLYILIISLIVLTGCISEKKIERRYYTIEIPPGNIVPGTDSISMITGNCEIEQASVSELYEKNQIVCRDKSNEISYYLYNQWAIRPSEAITLIIQEYLDAAGIFENISGRYSRSIPDYRFQTTVSRLELVENNKSSSAHLSMECRLIDNSNKKVIISHKAVRVNELKQNDLNLFALEISTIIYEELNIFAGIIKEKRNLFPGYSR